MSLKNHFKKKNENKKYIIKIPYDILIYFINYFIEIQTNNLKDVYFYLSINRYSNNRKLYNFKCIKIINKKYKYSEKLWFHILRSSNFPNIPNLYSLKLNFDHFLYSYNFIKIPKILNINNVKIKFSNTLNQNNIFIKYNKFIFKSLIIKITNDEEVNTWFCLPNKIKGKFLKLSFLSKFPSNIYDVDETIIDKFNGLKVPENINKKITIMYALKSEFKYNKKNKNIIVKQITDEELWWH
jgi:hypothetical protein